MANYNKTKQLKLDDYNFDDDLNIDIPDFEVKPPKNKREAIERVAKGAKEGLISGLKSPTFFSTLVKNALPKGFGEAIEFADNSASSIRDIYRDAVTEVRPALQDLARTTDKLMPQAEKYLPKSAFDGLKAFNDKYKDKPFDSKLTGQSAADISISLMMKDVFKSTAQSDLSREARQTVRDTLKEDIAQDRHIDSIAQLDSIRTGITQMAAYQRKVEFGFHKKSLELQARSYFVQVDTLIHQKEQAAVTQKRLDAIVENTALPDYVKLTTLERAKQVGRDRLINAGIGFFSQNEVFTKYKEAAKAQFMDGLKAGVEGFREGLSGIEMVKDTLHDADEFGIDKYQAGGSMLGGEAANKLAEMAGKLIKGKIEPDPNKPPRKEHTGAFGYFQRGSDKAGEFLGKQARKIIGDKDIAKMIRTAGNKLSYGVGNFHQHATEFAGSNKLTDDYIDGSDLKTAVFNILDNSRFGDKLSDGFKRGAGTTADVFKSVLTPVIDAAIMFGRDTVNRVNATGTATTENTIHDLNNNTAIFSNLVSKSITEIIPGYLGRIHQEIHILRTGNTKADLLQYNLDKGKFDTAKGVKETIFSKLVSKKDTEWMQNGINRALGTIDIRDQKLTPEQRNRIGSQIVKDSARNKIGKFSDYSIASYWAGESTDPTVLKEAQEIANHFKAIKESDSEHKHQADFATNVRDLTRYVGSKQGLIQTYLDMHQRATLEEMGVIDPENKYINKYALTDMHADNVTFHGKGIYASSKSGMRKSRSKIPKKFFSKKDSKTHSQQQQGLHNPTIGYRQQQHQWQQEQNQRQLARYPQGYGEHELSGETIKSMDELDKTLDDRIKECEEVITTLKKLGSKLVHEPKNVFSDFKSKAKSQTDKVVKQFEELSKVVTPHLDSLSVSARAKFEEARKAAAPYITNLSAATKMHYEEARDKAAPYMEEAKTKFGDFKSKAIPHLEALHKAASEKYDSAKNIISDKLNSLRTNTELHGSSDVLQTISETLIHIRDRLDSGILTQATDGTIQHDGSPTSKLGKLGLLARAKALTIADAGMWLGGKAWGATKFAGGVVNSLVGGGINTLLEGAKLIGRGVSHVTGKTYKRVMGFRDIYVGNEKSPRMYVNKLQNGSYFNTKTGKPIRRFSDITDEGVRDEKGIVLEGTEVKDAYVKDDIGDKSLKALGATFKAAKYVGEGLFSIVAGGIPIAYRGAMWLGKKAWGLLNMPQDVFTKDDLVNPKLTARTMRGKGYRSRINPSKIIEHPGMIDGPVIDDQNETVLTDDQIAKGLCDSNGKPIKVGIAKLFGMATSTLSAGWKTAKAVGDFAWKAGKEIGSNAIKVTRYIGGKAIDIAGFGLDRLRGKPWNQGAGVGNSPEAIAAQSDIKTSIDKIYDLLDTRLPKPKHRVEGDDGFGLRTGSYEDMMLHKNKNQSVILGANGKPIEKEVKDKKDGYKKAGGAGLVLGLWNKVTGRHDGETDANGESGPGAVVDRAATAAAGAAATAAATAAKATGKGVLNLGKSLFNKGVSQTAKDVGQGALKKLGDIRKHGIWKTGEKVAAEEAAEAAKIAKGTEAAEYTSKFGNFATKGMKAEQAAAAATEAAEAAKGISGWQRAGKAVGYVTTKSSELLNRIPGINRMTGVIETAASHLPELGARLGKNAGSAIKYAKDLMPDAEGAGKLVGRGVKAGGEALSKARDFTRSLKLDTKAAEYAPKAMEYVKGLGKGGGGEAVSKLLAKGGPTLARALPFLKLAGKFAIPLDIAMNAISGGKEELEGKHIENASDIFSGIIPEKGERGNPLNWIGGLLGAPVKIATNSLRYGAHKVADGITDKLTDTSQYSDFKKASPEAIAKAKAGIAAAKKRDAANAPAVSYIAPPSLPYSVRKTMSADQLKFFDELTDTGKRQYLKEHPVASVVTAGVGASVTKATKISLPAALSKTMSPSDIKAFDELTETEKAKFVKDHKVLDNAKATAASTTEAKKPTSFLGGIADKVSNAASSAWESIKNSSIGKAVGNAPTAVGSAATAVGSAVSGAATAVGSALGIGGDKTSSKGATGGGVAPADGLGAISKKYESGKAGPGTVSSGKGDAGGASYGSFQLASKTGTLAAFLKSSGYDNQFTGLNPGSVEFNAKWKDIAAKDPNFGNAQTDFIKKTHYDVQCAKLKNCGIDVSSKGRAIQEAIFSTSVQYGPGTSVIADALKGKDTKKSTDADLVTDIQDYKLASVGSKFKSSSPGVQAGISKRIVSEKADLLAMAGAPAVTATTATKGPGVEGGKPTDASVASKDKATAVATAATGGTGSTPAAGTATPTAGAASSAPATASIQTGITPTATGTPATPAATPATASVKPSPDQDPASVDRTAMLGGFVGATANASKDLAGQAKSQDSSKNNGLNDTNKILSDSLGAHNKTVDVLNEIAKILGDMKGQLGSKSSDPNANSMSAADPDKNQSLTNSRNQSRHPTKMAKAPISLAKPVD